MPDVSYRCRALLPGRQVRPFLRIFAELSGGHWIQGTVTLRDDHLIFSTNALNALHLADPSDFKLRYDEIASVTLGQFGFFLTTVDLKTSQGTVRFRCLFSSNEALANALRERMKSASTASL
jgi:hypothetical protein